MHTGKTLRLRRIFSKGRALIAGSGPLAEDPVTRIRLLVRQSVDAAVLTPGLLDVTLEELGSLPVILRLDGGSPPERLLSVEAALVMGADAALVDFDRGATAFAEAAEQARECGMPLLAVVDGAAWLEHAWLAADYGADVVVVRPLAPVPDYRQFTRATGKPCLVALDEPGEPGRLLGLIAAAFEAGAQGMTLDHTALLRPALLTAVHALVHQGISVEEAASLLRAQG